MITKINDSIKKDIEVLSRKYSAMEIKRLLKLQGISLPLSQVAYWTDPEKGRANGRRNANNHNRRKREEKAKL